MPNWSQVEVIGHLTDDPVMRQTQDGTPVCSFTVAVNDKAGDRESVIYWDVSAWRKLAEQCCACLGKGLPAHVVARPKLDEWTDKTTGAPRTKVALTALSVTFLATKAESEASKQQRWNDAGQGAPAPPPQPQGTQAPASPAVASQPAAADDDIPF